MTWAFRVCVQQKTPSDRENEKKRLTFAKNHQHWTPQQWRKVMFSDESTFRLVRGQLKVIRRSINVPRHDPWYTVKTVKHSNGVMVWGAFSGTYGRG